MILFSGLFVVFRGNASGNFATAAYHATLAGAGGPPSRFVFAGPRICTPNFPLSVYLFKCFFSFSLPGFLPLPLCFSHSLIVVELPATPMKRSPTFESESDRFCAPRPVAREGALSRSGNKPERRCRTPGRDEAGTRRSRRRRGRGGKRRESGSGNGRGVTTHYRVIHKSGCIGNVSSSDRRR